MTELTVGDLVTAGGLGGRVTAIRGTNVGVEFDDRPGASFWFSMSEVRAGSPAPKLTFMAGRFESKGMGQRVEVRPICKHATLADVCDECAKEQLKA